MRTVFVLTAVALIILISSAGEWRSKLKGDSNTGETAEIRAGPITSVHYINIYDGGTEMDVNEAAALGFNVLNVHSMTQLQRLPNGVRGCVWVPMCDGVTQRFKDMVSQYINNPKLWGFYVWDEPEPSKCAINNLAEQVIWIHANIPGAKVFTVLNDGAKDDYASYAEPFDYVGVDPFPCRGKCDFSYIIDYVDNVVSAGVPREKIIPVFQAFGGGPAFGGSGAYTMPNADQAQQQLAAWAAATPNPGFDYVYAWNWGQGKGLKDSFDLQEVFRRHNGR